MSALLEMMPTGMMGTGWDWGSMWLLMLFPGLAILAAIIIIVFLLLRHERQPGVVYPAAYPNPQPTVSTALKNEVSPSETPRPSGDVMGKVVLSLASTLTGDERRVMDELAKAGGEALQSDLPQLTGYSKATVSKAIHSLEVRGIILREPRGWTYWCRVNPRLIERAQTAPTD